MPRNGNRSKGARGRMRDDDKTSAAAAIPAPVVASASSAPMDVDDESKYEAGYFQSYSWVGIHEEMIKDRARTDAYRDAILKNKAEFKDKVVLDVGCGTAILSLFCADAGARKVYAVDASDMADYARRIVKLNGQDNVVEVIKGRMEDIQLPEKVDIIVSEWMGYFLLYESMLDSVIFARDKWLKPGGALYPSHATIYLTPFFWDEYYEDHIYYWEKVYGKNFSPLIEAAKKDCFTEPVIDVIAPENELAIAPCVIKRIDCNTVKVEDLKQWNCKFSFNSALYVEAHGLAAWFDVEFNGPPAQHPSHTKVVLNTAPRTPATHWAQTLFFWDEPLRVMQDDTIAGEIDVAVNAVLKRTLDVRIACTWSTTQELGGAERTKNIVKSWPLK